MGLVGWRGFGSAEMEGISEQILVSFLSVCSFFNIFLLVNPNALSGKNHVNT